MSIRPDLRMEPRRFTTRVGAAAVVLLLPACASPRPVASLDGGQPAQRVPALISAADQPGDETLARMIDALDDADPAVRAFAHESLQRATGEDFEYRYYQDADTRAPAVQRWRHWLAQRAATTP